MRPQVGTTQALKTINHSSKSKDKYKKLSHKRHIIRTYMDSSI